MRVGESNRLSSRVTAVTETVTEAADGDREPPGLDHALPVRPDERQRPLVEREAHDPLLSRLQRDPLEALERPQRHRPGREAQPIPKARTRSISQKLARPPMA